ncbi:MAG: hypothetical protein J5504_05150 [Butyrivibrio sp.]|nr:hypothetical protein [Butyrivibrio sp.]
MLMVAWSVVRLIYWMLVVPYLIGQLFNFILPEEKKTLGTTFILGLLVYLALFEVIAIPCMIHFTYYAFTHCRRMYVIVVSLLAIAGAFKFDKTVFKLKLPLGGKTETKIYCGIFVALVLFQMVMSLVYAPFNGDDADYVANSVAAQQMDVMNTVNPNLGGNVNLDVRHALAVITMWIAFIAKVSSVHAAIVSHVVMPLFVIPIVYYVYYLIGKILFNEKKDFLPVFLILLNVLMIFGDMSLLISPPATFFLMRSWQGKALFCNLVLPMVFWVFLMMFDDVSKSGEISGNKEMLKITAPLWGMLTLVNMFSGICTELGVAFECVLVAVLTLILLFKSKRWTVLVGAFMSLIPNLIYIIIWWKMGGRA